MGKLLTTCLFFLSAGAALLSAQSVGDTLSGRITSADGNQVANAAITVTNTQTNISQKATTAADSTFAVAALPPGTYRIDVESAAYKCASRQNFELTATGPASINITMEAGSVSETVELKATAPMTQTDNAEVSLSQDARVVHKIPVIDRNHQDLIQFQTGITPPVASLPFGTYPERNRFYSTNGQFPYLNQNYLNGVLNHEPFRNTDPRNTRRNDPAVQHLNSEPDYGQRVHKWSVCGGQLPRRDKSLHGDLFELFSGSPLRTRSFLDTVDNHSPRFTYNQFGASVGGPIMRDKLFLFWLLRRFL